MKKRLRDLPRELRYMSAENLAKDFKDKRSRAAIAAVFKWLSLNANVAWRLKNGTYTEAAARGRVVRDLRKIDALIMSESIYDHARKLLGAQ